MIKHIFVLMILLTPFHFAHANESLMDKGIDAYNTKNYQEAFGLFKQSCDESSAVRGCSFTGFMYRDGVGTKQNYKKAAKYFEKSCDKQDFGSCFNLGWMYENRQLGSWGAQSNANENFIKACEGGNWEGCTKAGLNLKEVVYFQKRDEIVRSIIEKVCTDAGGTLRSKHKEFVPYSRNTRPVVGNETYCELRGKEYFITEIDALKSIVTQEEKEKAASLAKVEQHKKNIVDEYKNGAVRYASQKELCNSIGTSSFKQMAISWSSESDSCSIPNMGHLQTERKKYDALKLYVLKHSAEVLEERKQVAKQKTEKGASLVAKRKEEGRTYANIAMDTTLEQNNLKIERWANGKRYVEVPDYAGLPVSVRYKEDGNIYSVSLGGEVKLDKLTKVYNSIKSKYKKGDVKEEVEKISLEQVKSRLLDWHQRNRSTQAAYDTDVAKAKPIKITTKLLTYLNAGDKITLKIVTTEEGADISYTVGITYLSKTIAQKELAQAEKARKLKEAKKAKADSELEGF